MTDLLIPFFLFIIGAGVGSLIGASIQRTNLHKLYKRSRCDNCKHVLAWSDLVPILSFIILRGKCRYCQKNISPRYFLLEIGFGCLFLLSYYLLPIGALELAVWLVILSLMISLMLTDLLYQKLPFSQVSPL